MKDEITTLLKSNPKISETLCEIGIMQVEQEITYHYAANSNNIMYLLG